MNLKKRSLISTIWRISVRRKTLALAMAVALQGVVGGIRSDAAGIEVKSFTVQTGDTLALSSDAGRILIRPADGTALTLKAGKVESDRSLKGSPEVSARKSGSTVFIDNSFSGDPSQAPGIEIQVPEFMNVTISGVNPEVDIAGIKGQVRIQDSGGPITAENLTGVVSITTDSADIHYKINVQPEGDARLDSKSGNINCELEDGLNLHSWIRAGGKIFWDMDAMVEATTLEKQIGTNGPLLYAASLKGNAVVRLIPAAATIPASVLLQTPASTAVAPEKGGVVHPVRNPSEARSPSPSMPGQTAPTLPRPSTPPEIAHSADAAARSSAPPSQTPAESVGQDTRPQSQDRPAVIQGGYALKVDVDSVFLNVSVREQATNRSIPGLQKSDFVVFEDGVQQQIAQFQPTEAPFNLLLLLDVSGSTASYLHLMKQAAIDFIGQINAEDRVAVAIFNSNVQLVQGFTSDRSAAERAIQHIKSGGGTAFYDALTACLNRYMRGVEGRNAIVVFTDGVDNQLEGKRSEGSRTTFDELYRRVQESDTIIYTIFLDTEGQVPAFSRGRGGRGNWPGGGRGGRFPGSSRFPFPFPMPSPSPYPNPNPYPSPSPSPRRQRDDRAVYEEARDQLMQIAEQTGGRMYSPHKVDELSGVYTEIANDLRIQYQLGYNSRNRSHDGKWREIRVEVVNHPNAVVRTRKGYYARMNSTQ
jgi:VWFA-related protein